MPARLEIDHSDEPVRLFQSNFLEFFTHISPIDVLIIWAPVAVFFAVRAALTLPAGASWVWIPPAMIIGV